MCVTWAFLWNTRWLGRSGCGHARPSSPRTLAVRAVDSAWTAVDEETAENLAGTPRSGLAVGVFADLLQLVVDPEHHHEQLEHHPVDAERQQHEDRLDDDQGEQAARDPAGLEADDQDAQADERGPDGEQDVEDLDDLRRDQGGEAEVEQRAEEALLARRPLPGLGGDWRRRLPLRRRHGRPLAGLGVARRLVPLVLALTLAEGGVRLVLRRRVALYLGLVLAGGGVGRRGVARLAASTGGRVGGRLPCGTALRHALVLLAGLE